MTDLYRLLRASGVTPLTFAAIALLACASSLLAAVPPHFLAAAVNAVAHAAHAGAPVALSPIAFMDNLLARLAETIPWPRPAVFLGLFFVGSLAFHVIRNLFAVYASLTADRFILHVRRQCFRLVLHGDVRDLARFEAGDISHRLMHDTQQLDHIVGHPLYTLVSDILDLAWVTVILLLMDWRLPAILAAPIPLLYLLSRRTALLQKRYATAIQENEARCAGFIQQAVTGLDTIKACQGEQREISAFAELIDGNFRTRKRASVSLGLFFPQEGALRALGTAAAIAFAVHLSAQDGAYLGAIPVILLYVNKFYAPLGNWARYYQTIQRGAASWRRLRDILALAGEQAVVRPPAAPEAVFPFRVAGGVTLESGQHVPLAIALERPGLVLLRGRSGVGKTRLVKALLGLGLPFEGQVRAGGLTVADCFAELRNHVALAAQDGHFVPGTLAENICYPSSRTDPCRCARILRELGLDHGPDHPVAEYGKNLSLGEQRRVMLGRALHADKPVLLLDEIDANVDGPTKARIHEVLRREATRRIVLMVSHSGSALLAEAASATVTVLRAAGARSEP